MKRGKCKLCGLERKLQNSHLIPAGVYPLCKAPGFDPVMMTNEFILPTQRQIRAYVLCRKCEGVLNKGGENWSVPLLAKRMGRFPLYELLNKEALIDTDDTMKAYAGSLSPGIRTEMLVHLALGIFYKAAVHGWKKTATAPIIDLGDALTEIGAFLLGEGPFPKRVGLLMILMPPPVSATLFTVPKSMNNGTEFFFYLPGLKFAMTVAHENPHIPNFCLHSSQHKVIFVEDLSAELRLVSRAGTKNAKRTRKFLEYLELTKQAPQ